MKTKKFTFFMFFLLVTSSPSLWTLSNNNSTKNSEKSNQGDISSIRRNLVQNYQIDYARGSHFGIDGMGYSKDGFHLSPAIEVGSDFLRWGFISIGAKMNYHQFYVHLFYRYTMPFFNFSVSEMGNSAVFRLGVNSLGFRIQNEFEGGKIRTTRNLLNNGFLYRYTAKLGIQNYLSLIGLLYDDNYNRLEVNAKIGYRFYTEVKEDFWEFHTALKYRNRHPWGEFGFTLFGWHADKITNKSYKDMKLESGINLWEEVLGAAFVLNQRTPSSSYFNTVTAINIEYRFYFLYPFLGGWRNFYLGLVAGGGFGFRHGNYEWKDFWINNFTENGLWWYGGSIGYNFHDALAVQAGTLINSNKELLILIGIDILSFSF